MAKAKPKIPPASISIKWRTFHIQATGTVAIMAVFLFGLIWAAYFGGKAFGHW